MRIAISEDSMKITKTSSLLALLTVAPVPVVLAQSAPRSIESPSPPQYIPAPAPAEPPLPSWSPEEERLRKLVAQLQEENDLLKKKIQVLESMLQEKKVGSK